jgi:hypothetical protein
MIPCSYRSPVSGQAMSGIGRLRGDGPSAHLYIQPDIRPTTAVAADGKTFKSGPRLTTNLGFSVSSVACSASREQVINETGPE